MTPFGVYLERLRRSRKLQQSQLASLIKVNPSYLSSMENGKKGPASTKILTNIVHALNLSDKEKAQFWNSVSKSQTTRRIPPSASPEEYELVDEIWKSLGSLTTNQISMMMLTLNIDKTSRERREYVDHYIDRK